MKTLKEISDETGIAINTLRYRAMTRGVGKRPKSRGRYDLWEFTKKDIKALLVDGKRGRRWSDDPNLRRRCNSDIPDIENKAKEK